jgi:HEAT repeat protein
LAQSPPQGNNVQLAGTTVAGRIARIDAVAQRAPQMTIAEAAKHVRSLDEILSENSPTPVKVAAARCLGQLPALEAVDVLGRALRDSDAAVRAEACQALARIDSPQALTLLAEMLAQESDVDAKLAAVRGLGRYRDPRAVQALRSALDDQDPAVQYVAMQSLKDCTGVDMGNDVRRWRELTEQRLEVLARRDSGSGRM